MTQLVALPYLLAEEHQGTESAREPVAAPGPVRSWLSGGVCAALLVGAVTLGTVQPAETVPLEVQTVTPQLRAQASMARLGTREETSAVSTASSVAQLRSQAALTWEQLGRLFGVSRRAVHLWASGKRMNAHNVELLRELQRLIAWTWSTPRAAASVAVHRG